jgi:diguanylate cyclase (GGDEF)-like protein
VDPKTNRQHVVSARFRKVAASVVADAADQLPPITWAVARAQGDALVVLCAAGPDPSVAVGDRIVPDPDKDVTALVCLPDGTTLGALCGLGAAAEGDAGVSERIERWAGLLAALAAAEWEAEVHARRADASEQRAHQVEIEALTDALTGLANRRAWDRALEAEERRRRRYGGTAAIVVVDLDELKHINDTQGHLHGDLVLRLVARIIQDASRESDLVARTGGDEFAVLALNCEEPQLRILISRLRTALEADGVAASVGGACRRRSAGMAEAWAEADEVMFEEKTRRKGDRRLAGG